MEHYKYKNKEQRILLLVLEDKKKVSWVQLNTRDCQNIWKNKKVFAPFFIRKKFSAPSS